MSLSTNIQDLAVAMGTEVKATRVLLNGNAADLSGLTTTQKTNLVAAINWLHSELNAVAGGAAGINDAATSTNTTWSSSKTNAEISAAVTALVDGAPGALDTIKELADALGGQSGAITAIETALANRVRFDATQTLSAAQQTQARANIGAGTSSLALGTTAGTAKAGDWKPAAADVSDATATGRSVLTAASQAAARTAIGAGTSNLALGTTAGTAKAGDYAPSWGEVSSKPATFPPSGHTHATTDISDSTATGRAVLAAVDAAAARTAIGAGTSNLVIGTTASTAKAGNYAPPTATETVQGVSELATVAETTAGTDATRVVTPAGLKAVTNGLAASVHTHASTDISDATATGRSLLSAADGSAARAAIGAGTSNLALGTTSSTAKAGNYQPTAANISDASLIGRTVLTAASAAAILTAIGAVSAAAVGDTERNFVADFQAALV